jgi:DNA primase large subunit
MQKKIVPKKEFKPVYVKNRIPEEAFPPCIKLMLNGMKDGKKRSLFTLINFLKAMAWEWDEIEQRIFAWNEKNSPKLNRSVLLGQLKWSKQQQRALNPANCEAEMFYKSIGVCKPDDFCKSIKNPMTYSLKRAVFSKKSQDKKADARKENTSKAVGKFKCYSCGKQFMSMKALMKHKDEKH